MKLFVTLIACICFAQVCLGAPAGDTATSDSSEYFTDADITEMRSDLKDIPGLNPKSVDNFTNMLKKFRKNSTDDETLEGVFELLALALQGPTCDGKNKVDLSKLLELTKGELNEEVKEVKEAKEGDKETKTDSSSSEELNDDELKAIEDELDKVVTPDQKKHAMRILGGFRKGVTENERGAAMMDLFMSGILSLRACQVDGTETNKLDGTENKS